MDNRLKAGIAGVGIFIIALALLVAYPRFGVADPSFDNTTRIYEVDVDNSISVGNSQFFDNGTTNTHENGYNVIRLQAHIYINKDHAATEAAAHANTRIYLTVRKPDNTIHYENYLDNTSIITDYTTYWKVVKRDNSFTPFALTDGTWTITTEYEVWA